MDIINELLECDLVSVIKNDCISDIVTQLTRLRKIGRCVIYICDDNKIIENDKTVNKYIKIFDKLVDNIIFNVQSNEENIATYDLNITEDCNKSFILNIGNTKL
ncbi:hypothetical protein AHEV_198 [Adoxophyes honmai entomopoxvirus 'L']|uniref:Uncharacterized protein n=1 Tax=Adoxophyes honmai entomopoxvirus 'L' TaxID=1293540 RepID=A0A916KPA1_9POXV|nr:hypothetical protein AHEV_198 [Adoxophyes honmai entomopoxvirus 'L']CCU55519.1 hypothetical protein AHEV_198 [Adoxophyes honmai entomopoxvirus 'L']